MKGRGFLGGSDEKIRRMWLGRKIVVDGLPPLKIQIECFHWSWFWIINIKKIPPVLALSKWGLLLLCFHKIQKNLVQNLTILVLFNKLKIEPIILNISGNFDILHYILQLLWRSKTIFKTSLNCHVSRDTLYVAIFFCENTKYIMRFQPRPVQSSKCIYK